jgi:hypothetical protein
MHCRGAAPGAHLHVACFDHDSACAGLPLRPAPW